MNLTTKYGVGDVVYRKVPEYRDFRIVTCGLCKGAGYVAIADMADRQAECPDCHGRGDLGKDFPVPAVAQALTIGQVTVTTQNKTDRGEKEVTYMAKETGVGSGTLHREENLFPTAEEALSENTD